MSVLCIQNGCSEVSSKRNSIPRSRGRSRRNMRPRARDSSVRASSTWTTHGPRDVSNRTAGCGMSFPWAGEALPRHEPARSSASKRETRRIGPRGYTISREGQALAHRTCGSALPLHAIEGAAELPEELLVQARDQALLHRVEIVLVHVELPAGQPGRARCALARARLGAVAPLRAGGRQAGEALALAG